MKGSEKKKERTIRDGKGGNIATKKNWEGEKKGG